MKVQVSRLTNQKCKKANERRELEDGLVKRDELDKSLASSFPAAVCFSFFMDLEIRQQITRKTNQILQRTICNPNFISEKMHELQKQVICKARRSYPIVVSIVGLSRGEGGTSAGWGGLQYKVSN